MSQVLNKRYASPPLEKVVLPHEGSMLVRQFTQEHRNTRPYWHYHPELELVYVNGGRGKRHIGSHLSYFTEGELVLIGSNLPHQGFTDRISDYSSETVVQMKPNFLGESFFQIPEMRQVESLLERSKQGLSFHGINKKRIGEKVESLFGKSKFDQILGLLDILRELSLTNEYSVLNANGFSMVSAPQDNDRLNKVLNHVRANFQKQISIPEIAELVSMTETSFCRYFKKITSKTFTQFLNEYRLVHASKLLSEREMTINEVCYDSGFSNYSHFLESFKSFTGKSPSNYRKSIQRLL